MLKRILISLVVIVLLVVVCGGLVGFNFMRDKGIAAFFANFPVKPATVSAVEVKPSSWNPVIEAIGTAKAAQGVDVASQASGVITVINFKANDRVAKDAVLVQIDDAVERADLSAMNAAVERDKAQLERVRSLRARNAASAQSEDEQAAELASSRSAVEKLKATLDLKRISAPFTGVIGIPQVDLGEYIQPGTVVATLQDLDTMRVDFSVPELQAPEIRLNQPVSVAPGENGDGGWKLEGHVIGIEPKSDPTTHLVQVRAQFDNPSGQMRPGQFVSVRVLLPVENNVLAVPQTAVITSLYGDYVYAAVPPEAGSKAAEAKADYVARQLFVQLGRRSGDYVEIKSGLEAGTQVVTAGQNKLDVGLPIVIDNTLAIDRVAPDQKG